LLIQFVHRYEILPVEVSILLVLRSMHVDLMNFADLPKEVLFIDAVTVLV
jgi:hypothetical protein